jgi:small GTP-binding protein
MEKDKVLRIIKEAARNKQTELSLSSNQLMSLPAEIGRLKTLTKLYLSKNQLKTLPTEIVELKNLTTLILSSNQLTSLPTEIGQLKNLTTLNISENQLTSLPAEIGQLKNLTKLNLSSNQLTSLPAEIGQLKNLTRLGLSTNQLTSLPAEIGQLKNLTKLNISSNQLTSLPAEIAELKTLTELSLSSNQLKTLPTEIVELKNLTTLILSTNQLTSLPTEIGQLKNLTKLNLSSNQLTSLPAEIGQLKNLIKLYPFKNQLTSLPAEIGQLKNLTRLGLSTNQLTSLPAEIVELENLTTLVLSKNQLTSLPAEIGKLENLTTLNLSTNQLTSLPAEIGKLKNLTSLYLSKNPLESPPPEIAKRGIEAIRSYFKSLEAERRALNEVKVLLVGDGGAGKTSLVKQVLGEEFDKHEPQTHGINLRNWKVRDILVHFWDFGGQEIMHATHQFFLSKRSLYILVLDGRRDEKTEYWLKHIESFGGDSPILVVLNKIDENPSFEANRKFLQEKYKGIKGFCRVSCAEGQGIKDFTGALSKAVANVELIETMWPKTWFNVKTQLEEMTDNFISIDEYKEMCMEEKITEKTDQDTLVDFLNDLGVILHFKDFELLDTHVLEPKWVTNAVYRIINSKKLAACNGVLKLDLLDEILKKKAEDDYYYPSEKYRYIIDLMKKFELCYEIDKETVLLPDLLEVQEPEFDFDYDATLKFVIDYDFLPKSVMPRFIVKMHMDIASDLRWRTGVVLEEKAFHSTAVIKADERDEKIYIYVDGEQKRDYFSAILFTFRGINRRFEKLKAIEKVPLPDEPEITVSYKHLITLEKNGIENFIPDGSEKKYTVKDLLGTIYVEKKTEEEILEILRELKDKSDTEETLLKKAEDVVIFQPNFMGMGIDVKKAIKKVFRK